MKILAVEEDWWDRNRLERLLKKALPEADINLFANTKDALEFARLNPIGAAFIDMGKSIHVPGYFLAKKILAMQRTNVILTNYEWEHLQDAMQLHVSGYIRKPLQYEDILEELQNLRFPLTEAGERVASPPHHAKQRHGLFSRFTNQF